MKKHKKLSRLHLLDISVGVIAAVLIAFGLWRSFSTEQPLCAQAGAEHQLTVVGDQFSNKNLTITQCDVIKIVNLDSQNYQFAFGVHDKHVSYLGFSEQLVRPNEFIVIDALEAGNFRIHDHLRDKAAVELTISPKN